MKLNMYQVDAFTKNVFGGNPAAVIPLSEWLPDDTLQQIAEENNLSETAYFVDQGDHFHLRWFTPECEVRLCGHATLATTHVLFNHLGYTKNEIAFKTQAGMLRVQRAGDAYSLKFPNEPLDPASLPEDATHGLDIPILEVYKGQDDYLIVTESQDHIESLQANMFNLMYQDIRGFMVTAPGNEVDFVSRCFFPNAGIPEDPVTGSAHVTMTGYWSKRLNKSTMHAIQLSAREGHVTCIQHEDGVELIGHAITYLTGEIEL